MKKPRMIHGVGINDSETSVARYEKIDGKWKDVWRCSFYAVWSGMIKRCYSKKLHESRPTYADCYSCDEWHSFSSFREWMESQDWNGKQLDKDLLVRGNKIYSPSTCVFVSGMVNNFMLDSGSTRGNTPIGVCWNSRDGKYQSKCCDPLTGKEESLGYFSCAIDAHKAWQARKHSHAMILADMQDNKFVAEALRARYAPGTIYI